MTENDESAWITASAVLKAKGDPVAMVRSGWIGLGTIWRLPTVSPHLLERLRRLPSRASWIENPQIDTAHSTMMVPTSTRPFPEFVPASVEFHAVPAVARRTTHDEIRECVERLWKGKPPAKVKDRDRLIQEDFKERGQTPPSEATIKRALN